ncbi:MAG: FkbM family methyltransferase [Burkholderiales bacterium]
MSTPLTLEAYEQLNPRCELPCEGGSIVFATPTAITRQRMEVFFTKEPCTLDWIASFSRGDVLVDVGANVGTYSLWAAKTRGARVFAFEPEAQNFALLNRNIHLNRLQEQITAYCAGVIDVSGWSELHLAQFQPGGSCHSVGEEVDFNHQPKAAVYTQGCITARLDDLVAQGTLPQPQHIKIDVDGFEPKVIDGARAVIADPRLRSFLIEVNQNLEDHRQMVKFLETQGFGWDRGQVARAERKSGPFKGCAEYVFRR